MDTGVVSSRKAVVKWAMVIVVLAWVTLGDLVLWLFAALSHSAVHDHYVASRFGPAGALWVAHVLSRDKRDVLGVPMFFLGLLVCFLATLPVVRSGSFQPGAHEIAVRGSALLGPMLLAKATCWVYVYAWGRSHIR